MMKRYPKWAFLGLVGGLLVAGPRASGQAPAGATGAVQAQQGLSNALYGGAAPTPFTPYLNPYLMQMSPGNPDYLTYMYMANQRSGGIGSGVISGSRVAPGAPAGSTSSSPPPSRPGTSSPARPSAYASRLPAEPQRATFPTSASVPGTNTGGHFMRGPNATAGAGRYFNRTSPARNNGR